MKSVGPLQHCRWAPQARPSLEIIIGGGTREALLAQKELFFRKARNRISNSVEFVDDANGNLRRNSPRARAPKKATVAVLRAKRF